MPPAPLVILLLLLFSSLFLPFESYKHRSWISSPMVLQSKLSFLLPVTLLSALHEDFLFPRGVPVFAAHLPRLALERVGIPAFPYGVHLFWLDVAPLVLREQLFWPL